MEGKFAVMEEMLKKLLELKTNPVTSEASETIGGHERGGNPNMSRGRENQEIEILEGEDGLPPLEPLSREEMSTGFERRAADFVERIEDFYRRGAEFERRRGESDEAVGFSKRIANKSYSCLYIIGSLSRLPKNESFGVTLKVLQCEVFTISPVQVYDKNVEFAPIGLIQMYNSGGAVENIDFSNKNSDLVLHIEGRGSGIFGAYSSRQPEYCTLNSKQVEFKFSIADNFLTLNIPVGLHFWALDIFF
ncbi:hypothetical protein M5K25_026859 [Dendrobium thyrsiflorum]|uniref:Uncharacterized protein n=1 Tax=Dendrobium thyrsiflorum TaxID=117978 RepID=A0ABD0TYL0_DENTH